MNALPACLAVVAAVLLAARGARAECAANYFLEAGEQFAYTGNIILTGWGNLASAYDAGATYVYQSPGSFTRQGYSGPSWFYRYSQPWDGYLTWQNPWAASGLGYSTDQVSWCLVFYITSTGEDFNAGCFVPSLGQWVDGGGNFASASTPPASVASPHGPDVCTACPTGSTSPAGSDAADDCVCRENSALQAGAAAGTQETVVQSGWGYSLFLLEQDASRLFYCPSTCYDYVVGSDAVQHDYGLPQVYGMALTPDKATLFLATYSQIHKVDLSSWSKTVWADNSYGSYFERIFDIAITPDGNFLVAISNMDNVIWKLSITGSCFNTYTDSCRTLLAGEFESPGYQDGTGSSAKFNQPMSIDVSPDGTNAIVWDERNHALRKIVLSSGQVTTLASNFMSGASGLYGIEARARYSSDGNSIIVIPRYLSSDFNIYVLDSSGTLIDTLPVDSVNAKYVEDAKTATDNSVILSVRSSSQIIKVYFSDLPDTCPCLSGFYDSAGTCEAACAADSYGTASDACTACPTDQVSPAGSDAEEDCGCSAGTYATTQQVISNGNADGQYAVTTLAPTFDRASDETYYLTGSSHTFYKFWKGHGASFPASDLIWVHDKWERPEYNFFTVNSFTGDVTFLTTDTCYSTSPNWQSYDMAVSSDGTMYLSLPYHSTYYSPTMLVKYGYKNIIAIPGMICIA
jgi:hypothetical protein